MRGFGFSFEEKAYSACCAFACGLGLLGRTHGTSFPGASHPALTQDLVWASGAVSVSVISCWERSSAAAGAERRGQPRPPVCREEGNAGAAAARGPVRDRSARCGAWPPGGSYRNDLPALAIARPGLSSALPGGWPCPSEVSLQVKRKWKYMGNRKRRKLRGYIRFEESLITG